MWGTTVIRADASMAVGTGHVRRCLSLVATIRQKGGHCVFLTRQGPHNLANEIRAAGCDVRFVLDEDVISDWETDAKASIAAIEDLGAAWLVVDSYALDARWQRKVRPHVLRIMAIDDLANRPHDADLLLDQTFGRNETDYSDHISPGCTQLLGSDFTLLRPGFRALRSQSIARRGELQNIASVLVSTGGGDDGGISLESVEQLAQLPARMRPHIKVIIPNTVPSFAAVSEIVNGISGGADLYEAVSDMEVHMAAADFAFGAGGTTSWERCCLGLPAAVIVTAENQVFLADCLQEVGAVSLIDRTKRDSLWVGNILENLNSNMHEYHRMVSAAADICDGLGADRVVLAMEESNV